MQYVQTARVAFTGLLGNDIVFARRVAEGPFASKLLGGMGVQTQSKGHTLTHAKIPGRALAAWRRRHRLDADGRISADKNFSYPNLVSGFSGE